MHKVGKSDLQCGRRSRSSVGPGVERERKLEATCRRVSTAVSETPSILEEAKRRQKATSLYPDQRFEPGLETDIKNAVSYMSLWYWQFGGISTSDGILATTFSTYIHLHRSTLVLKPYFWYQLQVLARIDTLWSFYCSTMILTNMAKNGNNAVYK